MFNIAITKENDTKFYDDTDGKPRQYPTLADALVTAQYHGLTQDADGLHFVKDGVSIDAVTKTTTQTPRVTTNRGGSVKTNDTNTEGNNESAAELSQANGEDNAQQT